MREGLGQAMTGPIGMCFLFFFFFCILLMFFILYSFYLLFDDTREVGLGDDGPNVCAFFFVSCFLHTN